MNPTLCGRHRTRTHAHTRAHTPTSVGLNNTEEQGCVQQPYRCGIIVCCWGARWACVAEFQWLMKRADLRSYCVWLGVLGTGRARGSALKTLLPGLKQAHANAPPKVSQNANSIIRQCNHAICVQCKTGKGSVRWMKQLVSMVASLHKLIDFHPHTTPILILFLFDSSKWVHKARRRCCARRDVRHRWVRPGNSVDGRTAAHRATQTQTKTHRETNPHRTAPPLKQGQTGFVEIARLDKCRHLDLLQSQYRNPDKHQHQQHQHPRQHQRQQQHQHPRQHQRQPQFQHAQRQTELQEGLLQPLLSHQRQQAPQQRPST